MQFYLQWLIRRAAVSGASASEVPVDEAGESRREYESPHLELAS
jgi:hypothetical protein